MPIPQISSKEEKKKKDLTETTEETIEKESKEEKRKQTKTVAASEIIPDVEKKAEENEEKTPLTVKKKEPKRKQPEKTPKKESKRQKKKAEKKDSQSGWKNLNRKERKEKLKKELAKANSRKEKRKIKKTAHTAKPWYKRMVSFRFLWKAGLAFSIFGLVAATAAGVGLYMWVAKDLASIEDIENRQVAKTTKIYASDGKTLLYEVGDNKRIDTTLDKIDDDIENAVVAIEDKRFYEHGAVDLRGISRAAWRNFTNSSGNSEGASTLTQQFARNVALSNEQTYERKLKEVVLSVRLEQKYGKDRILEMYLNDIYFGANIQGVEAAAQEYFNTSAEDVTLAQAATIASLPQNPIILTNDPEALEYRKNVTLDIMVEEGYITTEEAENAKKEKVEVVENLEETLSMVAPHFANYVNGILEEQFGQNTVRRGGLEVITTIDVDQQKIATSVVKENIELVESYGGSNAALVHIDPKTGFIKAMVGSRDFKDKKNDGQVNVATSLQQPGSSLKPFAYLLAFSKGYTPDTKVWDVETDFLPVASDGSVTGGAPYRPRNYSLGQAGPISLRQALATSLNIPAVKVLYLAGLPDFFTMLEDFGYTTFTNKETYGLSVVLGGVEVTLLEHTGGYATLASEGLQRDIVSIQKITDSEGNVIHEWKDEPEQVLDAAHVNTLTDVLSDTNARGYTFSSLNLSDRAFAAKTGTTDEHRDAWAMGYTPSVAVGVWTGNNDNSPMTVGADGSYVAAPILTDYVEKITEGTPAEEFPEAEYSAANAVLGGNLFSGSKDVRIDKISGKRIPDDCTTFPEEHIEVRSERSGHSILHYIDKNNPTVLSNISNPGNDPMYENWEKAIGNAPSSSNDDEDEDAISEEYIECDARDNDVDPDVSLNFSSSGEYSAKNFRFFGSLFGAGEMNVQFFIDGNLVDSQSVNLGDSGRTAPIESNYSPSGLTTGNHTMSVLVTDSLGRTAESSASIYYNNGEKTTDKEEEEVQTDQDIDEENILESIQEGEQQGKEEEPVSDVESILEDVEE